MARTSFYPKRQVIDVTNFSEIDFDEAILICVPKFAWLVARSYMSVQGSWLSSYAVEYFTNGYSTPDAGQFDTIQANLAQFLGETDMSCDLEVGLQNIVDQIAALVAKECEINLACQVGSSGAGGNEAIQQTYEDVGTDPPYGFGTYGEYETFKCAIAQMIADEIKKDVEYIKSLALTEISTVILAATLISPIPGDEIGALVGTLVVLFTEATLDALLQEIIDEIIGTGDELVCSLFLSTDVPGARQAVDNWSSLRLSTMAAFVLGFWNGNDVLNRLFQQGNFILPSSNCAACSLPPTTLKDTFTDIDGVTLVAHTPDIGGPWIVGTGTFTINNNQAKSNGATGSRIFMDATYEDAQISIELTPTSGGQKTAAQGVIIRAFDNNNYLAAGWTGGSSSGYWIAKRDGGSWDELEFVSAPETYETRTLQVNCVGLQIDLIVNGVPVLSRVSGFYPAETRYGFQLGQASASRVDNFLVMPIS